MAAHAIGNFLPWSIQCTQDPLYCNARNSTHGTVQELEQQDPPFGVIVHMDGDIHKYRAVVSQSSELVHSGDYVKLHPPFCQVKLCLVLLIMFIYCLLQFTYGQLVATIKTKSEHTLCLVRGFEPLKLSNGQQCFNNVECPLFTLTQTLFTVDSTRIAMAISMPHECQDSCKFKDTQVHNMVEREEVANTNLVFEHDWTQLLYCYNIFCILKTP